MFSAEIAPLKILADHAFFLGLDDPNVADRFINAVEQSTERLAQMPFIGAVCHIDNPTLFGLRRWPVKGFEKYVIFYLVLDDALDIVRILHTSQDVLAKLEIEP